MRTKLLLSFVIVVALFFVSIVVNYSLTQQIKIVTDNILLNNQRLSFVQQIDYEVRSADDNGAWYLISTNQSKRKVLYSEYLVNVSQVSNDLKSLDNLSKGLSDYSALASFNVEWQLYQSDNNVIFQIFRSGHIKQAQGMFTQVSLEPVISSLISYTDNRINQNKVLTSSLALQTQRVTLINGSIAILATVIGILIAWLLSNQISGTAKLVRSVALRVAEGDLTVESIVPKTNDELGDVILAMNTMVERLRYLIAGVESTVEKVASTSEELNIIADDTTKATNQIATSMQQLADGTEDQRNGTMRSTNVMSEVGNKVHKIAQSSSELSQFSIVTAQVAERGNDIVHQTMKQIDSIHHSVDTTSKMMIDLKDQSDQIKKMVAVITNIAEETNLLAINATIEAARAGDHGNGFAVVADEVRKLAISSADSAKEIILLVNSIREVTVKAVTSMDNVTAETLSGVNIVQQAIYSFDEIRESAKQISLQIQSVSAQTMQINADIHELNHSFESMTDIADKASEEVQNVAASAEEQLVAMEEIALSANSLTQLAQNLQTVVGVFNTKIATAVTTG
jgi:methyl-accepting chemotaxis protein